MNQTDLSRLRDGERARVTGIAGAGDMGHSPFGDPAAYRIRGAVVALRREDSRRVQAVLL